MERMEYRCFDRIIPYNLKKGFTREHTETTGSFICMSGL